MRNVCTMKQHATTALYKLSLSILTENAKETLTTTFLLKIHEQIRKE